MVVKRFIAGAVCPKCGLMDKIVNYQDDTKNYRECVSCGYKDEILIKPVQRELETRVNTTEEEKKAAVQVLNFPPKT
ncbi:hypothetical protein SAMN02745866_01174 [Alteromonadaceae bacterium Bs31]|nr:hypothetical protein SAMN02745866_01174 [Alteromonadaceae bacterium Bs31]